MKFALAFVLLIGISCQIGRGDCAPDTIYNDIKDIASDMYDYTKDAYDSLVNALTPSEPISDYLPSEPESIKDGISSMENSMDNMASNAEDSIKSGMDELNQAVQNI
ncbi:uncharacterized protein LOC113554044 [Rhopalosiphum maidis]|uniref:uncharacterized protein LOC113554044 n=1 Tax=Rhopalosiphum maidis TaxID=43146 RepID=UPI000EFFDCA4|nr:uncharacterized protein LOC113554044 [Rhopalosiphum maidis]